MNAAKPSKTFDRDFINDPQTQRETDRAQANRAELTDRIAQAIRHDGTIEPIEGLHFNRSSSPSEACHSVSIPALCAIAQGSKEVLLGHDRDRYDPMHYLLATVELLMGAQGRRLRQIAVLGGYTHDIARAIERLRNDNTQKSVVKDAVMPNDGKPDIGE
jgi:AraC-type transcriptional regulator N-terminus